MKTFNTYQEAKNNYPDKVIVTTSKNWIGSSYLRGKFRPNFEGNEALRVADGWWEICNPVNHCMSLKSFFDAGYKFVDGDKYLAISGFVMKIGYDISPDEANDRDDDSDKEMFVLSAKALGEAKRGSLQSLKKKALSNPKVKEEYDTLETEFEKVEWKNGDECVFMVNPEGEGPQCNAVFIAYHPHHPVVVIDNGQSIFATSLDSIRKKETPEQKKEREREMAVYDMCSDVDNHTEEARLWAERFYDAGYRKSE